MINVTPQEINISADEIDTWYPMIALPCYDRQVTEPFFMSMMKLAMYFKEYNLRFAVSTLSDSLISRARNQLVAKFMANPDFTHLLFIDVDLAFNYEDILKMLWHDKEIVVGAYPIKDINWDKVVANVGKGVPADKLGEKATRFVVNTVSAHGSDKVRIDKGALSIYDAGTGFMMIKRSAFERMFAEYPELKYNDDTGALKGAERDNSYALFNSYVDPVDQRFLSEDYGFGRYWQKMGGEVWVDPSIQLMHLGRFEYHGNMIDWLQENTSDANDTEVSIIKPEPAGKSPIKVAESSFGDLLDDVDVVEGSDL